MNVSPRRRFLRGMAGILATGMAPAIITTPGLLMPVHAESLLVFDEEMLSAMQKSLGEAAEAFLYVVKSANGLALEPHPIAHFRSNKWKSLDDESHLLVRA